MLERYFPLLLLLSLSCRNAEDTAEVDPIIGGRIDRTHEAVGEVGRIVEGEVGFHCSGTLIGPRTVLTAAHCLFAERRLYAPDLAVEIGGVVHPCSRSSVTPDFDPDRPDQWEDAAVLRLREPSDVPPIPVSLDPPLEGVEAEVLGFGVTADGTGAGRRRRATITLTAVTDREIFYDSSTSGACYGDSGGPILQNGALVGVTSRGTADDCRDVDIAQRADVLGAWIGRTSRGDACIGWCEPD